MKRFKIDYSTFGLLFFLLTMASCRSVVDDDFPDFAISPVVNSILKADSCIRVNVSLTANLSDTIIPPVKNALVIVQGSSDTPDTLLYAGKGWYESVRTAKAGQSYTCKVTIPHFAPIIAKASIPKFSSIKDVVYTYMAGKNAEGEIYSSVSFSLENDIQQRQYFEVKVKKIESPYIGWVGFYISAPNDLVFQSETQPLTIFSNLKMKGESHTIKIIMDRNDIDSPSARYILELRSVDESYYKYVKHHYLYETGAVGSNLGETSRPYALYTNIENGYGIFTAYSSVFQDI